MSKKERFDSYSHILKYIGLFGGVQALSIGVALVRNKLVALILGPGGMGLVSLFNSTVSLVADLSSFGIGLSAVQEISKAYEQGGTDRISRAVNVVRYWSAVLALLGTALIVSVPIYYFWGMKGIVPSLVLMALIQFLLTIHVSYHLYPLRLHFSKALFHDGLGMIKLGTAFVIAGLFTSGTDFFIRSYLNNIAGLDIVGLYNAGIMMTLTYVGMVFSAMDTDYFPRLSGIKDLDVTFNTTVNRQIEMIFLLVSPLLVAFIIFLPIIVPLLYSGKFLPVLGMAQVVVLAMYFRAVEVPIEYITLAPSQGMASISLPASSGMSRSSCQSVFWLTPLHLSTVRLSTGRRALLSARSAHSSACITSARKPTYGRRF